MMLLPSRVHYSLPGGEFLSEPTRFSLAPDDWQGVFSALLDMGLPSAYVTLLKLG